MTRPDVEHKFNSNVDRLLQSRARDRLIELSASLEKLPNLAGINEIMAAPFSEAPAHPVAGRVETR